MFKKFAAEALGISDVGVIIAMMVGSTIVALLCARLLARIIDRLTESSRLEQSLSSVERGRYDLAAVVREDCGEVTVGEAAGIGRGPERLVDLAGAMQLGEVDGLGAAQFGSAGAVDRLRTFAEPSTDTEVATGEAVGGSVPASSPGRLSVIARPASAALAGPHQGRP